MTSEYKVGSFYKDGYGAVHKIVEERNGKLFVAYYRDRKGRLIKIDSDRPPHQHKLDGQFYANWPSKYDLLPGEVDEEGKPIEPADKGPFGMHYFWKMHGGILASDALPLYRDDFGREFFSRRDVRGVLTEGWQEASLKMEDVHQRLGKDLWLASGSLIDMPNAEEVVEDDSARRDREHKPTPPVERPKSGNFPDLKGWEVVYKEPRGNDAYGKAVCADGPHQAAPAQPVVPLHPLQKG